MQQLYTGKREGILAGVNAHRFALLFHRKHIFAGERHNAAPIEDALARDANEHQIFAGVLFFDEQRIDRAVLAAAYHHADARLLRVTGEVIG